jgi:predicted kinase
MNAIHPVAVAEVRAAGKGEYPTENVLMLYVIELEGIRLTRNQNRRTRKRAGLGK